MLICPQCCPQDRWAVKECAGTSRHKVTLKNKELCALRGGIWNRVGRGETDEWWPETLLHTRLRVMFRALGSRKTGKTCRILRVPSQVIGKSCPRSCPQYSDYDRLAADGLIRHILTPGPRSLFLFLSNVNCYVPPLLLPAGPLRSWQFSFS